MWAKNALCLSLRCVHVAVELRPELVFHWYFSIFYSSVEDVWRTMSCSVVSHDWERCSGGPSLYLPSSESAGHCRWGWRTDGLRLRNRVPSSLWTVNMLVCWGDDRLSSASPLPAKLTFISSIRCNSSVNQPMFRETERAAKSPAAPIYSPVNFPPLSWSLMSSTSVSTSHPQHSSLSFIPPPHTHTHLFLFLSFLRAAVREDAWFMKLYFYQLLRRKRGEKQRGREGEKRREKNGGESVKSEPKGKEDRRVWRRHPSPCDPSA